MTTTNMLFSPGGVSLKYLESLTVEDSENCDVNAVCRYIQSITKETGGSLHSFLSADESTRPFICEVAELFISYAWSYNWKKLLSAVRDHIKVNLNREDVFVWIDVAIVNQNSAGDKALSPDALSIVFGGTLEKIGKALIVFMPLENPIAVNRCWCVFEWFTIVKLKIPYSTAVPPDEQELFISKVRQKYLTLEYFQERFDSINVQYAKAREKEDELMIQSAIREFGIFSVNNVAMLNLQLEYERLLMAGLIRTFGSFGLPSNSDRQVTFNLQMTYGGMYLAYDEHVGALTAFEKAERVSTAGLSADQSELYHYKGIAEAKLGRLESAVETLNRSRILKQMVLGPTHLSLADTLIELGKVHLLQKKTNAAFDCFNKALDILQPQAIMLLISPFGRVKFGEALFAVGNGYAQAGQLDVALQQFNQANEVFGTDHRRTADAFREMGRIYMKRKTLDKALEMFNSSLAVQLKTLGPDHPAVAASYCAIADVYKAQKDKPTSLENLEKALTIYSKLYDPTHVDVQKVETQIKRLSQKSESHCNVA